MYTDQEIREIGMDSLVKALGIVDTERFISGIIRDGGDYTLSRRKLYDNLSLEEVFESADAYMKEHPLSEETKARLEKSREE